MVFMPSDYNKVKKIWRQYCDPKVYFEKLRGSLWDFENLEINVGDRRVPINLLSFIGRSCSLISSTKYLFPGLSRKDTRI
jgi:hypothetical protein